MENAEALVLRSVDFSESSLVLTLYTKESGKIAALAKGGRRLKGPFESALDILARIRVTFIQKKGDALDLLTESKLIHRFQVRKSNLAGLYGAYYVAELVDLLTDANDPSPPVYTLAVKTLAQLEEGTFVMRSLLRFEGLILTLTGNRPSLRHCVGCGVSVETDRSSLKRVAFGSLDGGVLCPRCSRRHRQWTFVSTDAVQSLERLTDLRDGTGAWKRFPLKRDVLGEMRGIMNRYLAHQIGKKPRLYDWLKFISKNDREPEERSASPTPEIIE